MTETDHRTRPRSAQGSFLTTGVARPLTKCEHCGALFRKRESKIRFCSVACGHAGQRKNNQPEVKYFAHTLTEIADVMGVSTSRADQILQRALDKVMAKFALSAEPLTAPERKRRSRKPRRVINSRGVSSEQRALVTVAPEPDYWRPKVYGDCDDIGVCPFISCRHHLLIDSAKTVTPARSDGYSYPVSSIKFNPAAGAASDIESMTSDELVEALCRMPHTCSLKAAEEGARELEDIGEVMGYTRERMRQVEADTMSRLSRKRHLRVVYEEMGQ